VSDAFGNHSGDAGSGDPGAVDATGEIDERSEVAGDGFSDATGATGEVEEFGPYLVYERLGQGGMATIHRAEKRGVWDPRAFPGNRVATERQVPCPASAAR
jgi:hypothetical protein